MARFIMTSIIMTSVIMARVIMKSAFMASGIMSHVSRKIKLHMIKFVLLLFKFERRKNLSECFVSVKQSLCLVL